MHLRLTSIVSFVLALAVVPAFAAPPNLVMGGSFDTPTDLQPWFRGAGTYDWAGVDGQARPDSGSVFMFGPTAQMQQCIAGIVAGKAYDFGGRALVTRSFHQPPRLGAFVQVEFMDNTLCHGVPLSDAVTRRTLKTSTGRFVPLANHVIAPDGTMAVRLTVVGSEPGVGAATPILFDDIFFRESGAVCAPDETTLCLSDNRFSVSMRYYDQSDVVHDAPIVQLSPISGYFYTYSPDVAEVTAKADAAGGRSFVIGGMTNLRLEITVKDWTTGAQQTYTNPPLHLLSPIVAEFPRQ